MSLRGKIAFGWLAVIASFNVCAQVVSTDLGVEVSRTGEQVTQTEVPVITLTASNLGPNTASAVQVTTTLYDVAIHRSLAANIVVDPGCSAIVQSETDNGVHLVTSIRWSIGTLGIGQTQTCQFRLQAQPSAVRSGIQLCTQIASAGVNDSFGNNNLVCQLFYLSAITFNRDLELKIRSPAGLFPADSTGTIDFVLTNHGPSGTDPDGYNEIVVSDPYLVSFGDDQRGVRFDLATTGDSDCIVTANDIDGVVYQRTLQIAFLPLSSSGSRTCTMQVSALPGAVGLSTLRFRALSNHPGEVDPVQSNNSAFVVLQHTFLPTSVPAASLESVVLLVLLMLGIGTLAVASRAR